MSRTVLITTQIRMNAGVQQDGSPAAAEIGDAVGRPVAERESVQVYGVAVKFRLVSNVGAGSTPAGKPDP
jgi:hypothetical protein